MAAAANNTDVALASKYIDQISTLLDINRQGLHCDGDLEDLPACAVAFVNRELNQSTKSTPLSSFVWVILARLWKFMNGTKF